MNPIKLLLMKLRKRGEKMNDQRIALQDAEKQEGEKDNGEKSEPEGKKE